MTEKRSLEQLSGVDQFLPDGTHLLASCFDAHHTVGGGLFALGAKLEGVDGISSTGMCVADGMLYRCLWSAEGSPAELVVYDETGVRRYQRLDDVSTPHDILVADGQVFVVATTQNEVRSIAADGSVRSRWRPPGEPDSWHLNSLAVYGDRMVVCGFGPFLRRRGWDESGKPATGRVLDMANGEPILSGLRAPHNPYYADGTWLVCDSAAGQLVEVSDQTRQPSRRLTMPGWPRGLAVTDRYLFVGLSAHRHMTTAVGTASVVVVDRAEWRVVGAADLPSREVYALVLAPSALVTGAAEGFRVNHTRAHEQGQRQLFDRLGRRPRRFWAVGDRLLDEECRAVITADGPVPDQAEAGSLLTVDCLVRNSGPVLLTPAPPHPVRVVHRWYTADGEPARTQEIKSALTRSLPPDAVGRVPVRARVPETAGRYRLRITLAQDGGVPFDELDPAGALDLEFDVVPGHDTYDALTGFGLYPSEVREACASDTVETMVQALLYTPTGAPRGITLGLIEDRGRSSFVTAVATAMRCTENSIRYLVDEAIPNFDSVVLTGAEAVALEMHHAGVEIVFGYAGTSELALCDATARIGLLVNGRGDRECLFQAAGASRLRPGNGAAILHAARGLTNALGALGAARRNEAGTLAVVGMPSTSSAPFLPPHYEPDLIEASGKFAKSWIDLGPVPDDPAGRADAARDLVAALRQAMNDVRQAPYGPVLFAVPQDVAESAWVPLAALRVPALPDSVKTDPAALQAAGALLSGASRPVVMVDDYALLHQGLRSALRHFCDHTGSAVLQVKYRRGPMFFERLRASEVPNFIGWYNPGDPVHQAVLAKADAIITVEDRNMYPRVIGTLPAVPKIALTTKPSAVAKNGYLTPGDVLVHGDIVRCLRSLPGSLGTVEPWYTEYLSDPPWEAEPVPKEALAIWRGLSAAVRSVGDELAQPLVWVDDSQMFGGLLAEVYELLPEDLRVFGDHGGFVGGGTATATGLALGEPSVRVVCALGDQGFTNGLQGLVAAVQESAPLTFVVCNNGGSVSLRKQSRPQGLLDRGFNRYLDNAAGMRYSEIATVLGMRSWRVDLSGWLEHDRTADCLEAFRQALSGATAHPGPTLIELVLPPDPEFWRGVWITEGFEAQKQTVPAGGGADIVRG
jgi:acetolactate synthase-1/2/3 large subunit